MLAAAVCLLSWRSVAWQRAVATAGVLGLLASAAALVVAVDRHGMLCVQVGGWPAPFGITLAADRFSAIMVALAGVMGTVVCLFSLQDATRREAHRGFFPLLLVLLTGVSGAFLTGDLFNLYVWFEVLLIASFCVSGAGGRPGASRGRGQVRHAQSGGLDAVPLGHGRALRRD